ncbi:MULTISPECIES: copper chaperone PCu(A)C [Luteimonas]|uniref:copper chaperone PCu(A)C n=1 Tax=Luteimonas TaxID=83614 RepID=UPI000C7A06CB|nr:MULTISPECIES: copper chaperone PCu(A)C [Luteimonas]
MSTRLAVRAPRAARLTLSLLAGLVLAACAPADEPAAAATGSAAAGEAITVSDAWIRQPPPTAAVAGGYLTLHNAGATDDRLVSVETAAAGRVEMHEMQMDNGMMRMRELPDGVPLPAGAATALAPGGNHLMLLDPQQPLEPGATFPATLTFEHAAPMTVTFEVRPMSGEAPHSAH